MREDAAIELVDMGEYEDMSKAMQVGEALNTAYPGHLWMVTAARGVLIIKNGVLAKFGQYGMVLPKDYSASHLKEEAIKMGGELLERCGLPRGAWNGDIPKHLEGANPKHRRDINVQR